MGEYRIRKTETGYVFHLRANNRQGIGVSQMYVSLNGCKRGTETVRKNCRSKIEDLTLQTPEEKTHPKYVVYSDKDEAFRFRLKASNGQTVLVSQAYTTKSACMNGIESVMNHAPDAVVVVVEYDEKQDDDELFDEIPVATPVVKEKKAESQDEVEDTSDDISEEQVEDEPIEEISDDPEEDENADSQEQDDADVQEQQDVMTAEEEKDEIIEDEAEDELRSGRSEDATDNEELEEEEFVTEIEKESGTETSEAIAEHSAGSKRKSKWKLIRMDIFWYFRKHKKR